MAFAIYFDPHMLLYSMDAVGARLLCPADDWRLWLATADVLQLNAIEFSTLCNIAELPVEPFHESAMEIILQLRAVNRTTVAPWALIRTAHDSVDVYFEYGDQWLHEKRVVAAAPIPHPAYTVGCRDAFGAGVFSILLRSWGAQGLLSGLDLCIHWAKEKTHVLGLLLTLEEKA